MNYISPENIIDNPDYFYCSDIDFYNNQTYVPIPDGLDDCCQYLGCLDPLAVNYNPNATIQELVFTSSSQGNLLFFSPIPILSTEGDTIGYEDTCYPYIYGCMDPIAENYNDYDGDGQANTYVTDVAASIYQLTDININENGNGLFGINQLDLIEEFNLLGNSTNINTEIALDANGNPIQNGDINSVNPCEYIYGCTDPCYVEYYNVVEYSFEEAFNFNTVNGILNNNNCDFSYTYGCTELVPPNNPPTIDDGSCANLLVYGCTDPLAANYNPAATLNDCLSCIPAIEIDFEIIDPTCETELSGSYMWSISGCVPPYQYSLFNNEEELIFNNQSINEDEIIDFILEIGSYFIEVEDFSGYTASTSFSINSPSDFIIDLWESGGWLNTVDGYDTYQWTLNGDILVGSDFETYQIYPTEEGLYGVTASFEYDSGLCISNTVFYNYDLFQNTIHNQEDLHIMCIPNPMQNQAIVYINNNNALRLQIDLYDAFGQQVWEQTKIINQEKSFVINDLAVGIYYFRATAFNKVETIPIIVIK